MFNINSPGATFDGQFTEGNPGTGVPATVVSAAWLNMVQAELKAFLDAEGITPDTGDNAQVLAAVRALVASVPGSRNQVVNGDLRVWQRRTTFQFGTAFGNPLSGYVADRWLHTCDSGAGTGTATCSRQPFTVGQTAVPGDPVYLLRHNQTAAATATAPSIAQKVEGVRGYTSGHLTLSFWLLGASAYNVTARVTQNFGTGGSPSAPVVLGSQVCAVSAAWTKFELTVPVTSIAGKTLGTAGNDHLLVEFVGPLGQTFTLNLARVQLEVGQQASDFEVRPLALEASLCRRYYEKSYELDTVPGTATFLGASQFFAGYSGGTQNVWPQAGRAFAVEKRAAPAVTWFDPNGANLSAQISLGGSGAPVTGTTNISRQSPGYPNTSVGSTFGVGSAHWTAEAEI